EAIERAVIVPPRHPDHDPRCVTATFDDGTEGGFTAQQGEIAATADGRLRFATSGRALLPDSNLADGTVLLALAELPPGARFGAVLRAADPEHGGSRADGTQTWAGLERDAEGAVRAFVRFPRDGRLETLRGPILASADGAAPGLLRIDLAGSRVTLRATGAAAAEPLEVGPIPAPPDGGMLSLEAEADRAVLLDWLLVRPAGGPLVQLAADARGEHSLAWLAPTPQAELPLDALGIRYDDLRIETAELHELWPTRVAAGEGHLILSSVGARRRLEPGRELVVELDGRRDALLLR